MCLGVGGLVVGFGSLCINSVDWLVCVFLFSCCLSCGLVFVYLFLCGWSLSAFICYVASLVGLVDLNVADWLVIDVVVVYWFVGLFGLYVVCLFDYLVYLTLQYVVVVLCCWFGYLDILVWLLIVLLIWCIICSLGLG